MATYLYRGSDTQCRYNINLCDEVCQWLAPGRWFSTGTAISPTNKTDRHDIAEILLKVALNTITLTPSQVCYMCSDNYRYTRHRIKLVTYVAYATGTALSKSNTKYLQAVWRRPPTILLHICRIICMYSKWKYIIT